MSHDILTIGDKDSAEITLLWFHGYGANNWSFEPFIKFLNLNLDGRMYVSKMTVELIKLSKQYYLN